MKKIITLTIALAIMGFVNSAKAQDSDNDQASVTANVVSSISVSKDADLNFGSILNTIGGETITIAKDGTGNQNSQAGQFTIGGSASAPFILTASNQSSEGTSNELSDGAGHTLGVLYTLYGNSSDDASAASTISENTEYSLNTSGNYYVYLGGSISTSGGETAGTYSGTYTLTATYN